MVSPTNQTARRLFAPIAPNYERWARLLSLGQDGRWRRRMIEGLDPAAGEQALDAAAGTGSISRLLEARSVAVTAVDISPEMIARHHGRRRVLSRAEELPFPSEAFDIVTFGYLLRYVEDPVDCLVELRRVLRAGGRVGMVEFGWPKGIWRPLWRMYSDWILPTAGRLIGKGWFEVGGFLRQSIEGFHRLHPDLIALFERAGFTDVSAQSLSCGGGILVWARRP